MKVQSKGPYNNHMHRNDCRLRLLNQRFWRPPGDAGRYVAQSSVGLFLKVYLLVAKSINLFFPSTNQLLMNV